MSNGQRSIDFDDKMMHHIFDMDSGYKPTNSSAQQRKNRMKRMEELSHSLDDGLNDLPDDYGRHGTNRGRQMEPQQYFDDDEDDFMDPEYIDDYYYNNSSNNSKQFDGRPKSYNDKYAPREVYEDYEAGGNFHRNRYSLNESSLNNSRYQQSPVAQQKHSTLRRPQGSSGPSGPSGSSSGNGQHGQHGSNKHILFNDEDDVHYMSEKKKSTSSSTKSKPVKKESKKELPLSSSSLFSSKKKPSKEDLAKPEKASQQVMKAKLKIQSIASDDSVLHTRPPHKTLHRHHSVEAKLPSHGSDRSNMSPTIMEEIEFEMQDVETETEKEIEKELEAIEKVKEKPSKEKAGKEKKGDSAPSTPTTKKSFKAHLSNHKKLFKVPDIDLNRMKFSCFFSSNKNIAALKGAKKEESTSKSAEALNEPSPKASPKSSPTTKSPPASPKKPLKSEPKLERVEEKLDKSSSSRTATSKTTGSGSTIQSSSEGFFKEEEYSGSASDVEFEVKFVVQNYFTLIQSNR